MSADARFWVTARAVSYFVVWLTLTLGSWADLGAQTTSWPPITAEELAIKEVPNHPSSPAMVLNREVYVDDKKRQESWHVRMKILSAEGRKYADVELPYYEKVTEIEDVKARTIAPDGTISDFTGQVFDREIIKSRHVKINAKTFTFPSVVPGSIIEYAYTRRWKEKFPDIVTHQSDYIITYPFAFPTVRWVVADELFTRRQRFVLRYLDKTPLTCTSIRMKKDPVKQNPDGTLSVDLEDVSGFEKEEFMPPADYMNSRVHCYYTVGRVSRDAYWSSVGRLRLNAFEEFMNRPKAMQQEVGRLVNPSDPPETKARKIYARVQQLRYIAYERRKSEQERKREELKENKNVEDILNHGYTFGNEANLLFVALARAAGLQADIVETADREASVFDASVLDSSQLNAMIVRFVPDAPPPQPPHSKPAPITSLEKGAAVPTEKASTAPKDAPPTPPVPKLEPIAHPKDVFLDPATRYCPYGLLPWGESAAPGLLLQGYGGTLIDIGEQDATKAETERNAVLMLLHDGSLDGSLVVAFRGQEALVRRLKANDQDETGRRKLLEDEIKTWLPNEATATVEQVTNWEGSSEPLLVQMHIHIPNFGIAAGKRMLLPANVFQRLRQNPLPHSTRVHPIYFHYAYQEFDNITIKLPRDVRVETVPVEAGMRANFGGFYSKWTSEGASLQLKRIFRMNSILFPANTYQGLRDFFDKALGADEEKIVLQAAKPPN